ncbi:hypothetical protein SAMN04487890_11120 [Mucilaginibacter polytrichastri]|nr:hypothetical protein SAMN04487890_11120 [Mucilaginibacter polytrichastri]
MQSHFAFFVIQRASEESSAPGNSTEQIELSIEEDSSLAL